MAGFRIIMLLMQVSFSLLLIGLSIPLIKRMVAPNSWYGFRVRQTLEDPAVWYEANAYSGRCLLWAGIAILFGSVVLFKVPGLNDPTYATCCAGCALSALGVAMFRSFRFLGRIAKPADN
jgi:hypothetical protein